jgi:hypothetical protein
MTTENLRECFSVRGIIGTTWNTGIALFLGEYEEYPEATITHYRDPNALVTLEEIYRVQEIRMALMYP